MNTAADLRTIRETAAYTAGHDMARDLIKDGIIPIGLPYALADRLADTITRVNGFTADEHLTWRGAFLDGFAAYLDSYRRRTTASGSYPAR